MLQHADVFRVAAAGWHGDVHSGAESHALARLARGAGARVERELMGRDVEDRGVLCEAVLAAIAVVDIPIEDQNLFNSNYLLECPRCDRDPVEQTKPHRTSGFCVVTRRAQGSESAIGSTLRHIYG